jgi:hypothetical protein
MPRRRGLPGPPTGQAWEYAKWRRVGRSNHASRAWKRPARPGSRRAMDPCRCTGCPPERRIATSTRRRRSPPSNSALCLEAPGSGKAPRAEVRGSALETGSGQYRRPFRPLPPTLGRVRSIRGGSGGRSEARPRSPCAAGRVRFQATPGPPVLQSISPGEHRFFWSGPPGPRVLPSGPHSGFTCWAQSLHSCTCSWRVSYRKRSRFEPSGARWRAASFSATGRSSPASGAASAPATTRT